MPAHASGARLAPRCLHWRTSTARRCATRPSASASAATTGARLRKPARRKSAARWCSAQNPRWKGRRASARRRSWAARDWCRWRNRRSIARSTDRRRRCPPHRACRSKRRLAARNAQMLGREAIRKSHRSRRVARDQYGAICRQRRAAPDSSGGSALSCSATRRAPRRQACATWSPASATASGSCSACAIRSAAM